MNSLSKWFQVINEMAEDSKQQEIKFNKELPKPDSIFKNEILGFEYGYWKIPEGIVRIRKYKRGYDYHSQMLISNMEMESMLLAYNK